MTIKEATGAKSTAEIIARKVVSDYIVLTLKNSVVITKLKDWNLKSLSATPTVVRPR